VVLAISYINTCKNVFPYCDLTLPPGNSILHYNRKLDNVNLNISGAVVLEKIFLKDYSYINTCKNGSLSAMILYYVRKLPCKFKLFWLNGS
jgi:hypothetical protein